MELEIEKKKELRGDSDERLWHLDFTQSCTGDFTEGHREEKRKDYAEIRRGAEVR